ncbi:UNVERIFIED_CONTAM: Endoplasmic reticulum-Golgi intermediate compartment protein 3 [Sesamum radiatum]|uniref:Endoplasmic reticulum-Golgi intermediate compartment protein 3 n=1 Tax=Sesamum radiatum TaxID=300843 RepID=A0AAW2QEX8_SESRA
MGNLKQALRSLDAFPRAEEHLLQKTKSGAIVSIVGLIIMATLFLHELTYYLSTYTVHQMAVDLKRGETLPIHINMTFPSLPCDVLSVDAIDMSGKHEVDLDTNIWKLRLNKDGQIVGTEYLSDLVEKEHAHGHGDNKDHHEESDHKIKLHTLDEGAETMVKNVKHALANGEGCRVYGVLDVQRVAGNFHISVHGLNIFVAQMIVPTEYKYISKEVLPTNQFSVTEYFSPISEFDRAWPAVYFLYDLSPITVTIREERRSFLHFITRLCAVLGGTFALTGMLDRWMYRLVEALTKPNSRSIIR